MCIGKETVLESPHISKDSTAAAVLKLHEPVLNKGSIITTHLQVR
jgi:hypothetical protein